MAQENPGLFASDRIDAPVLGVLPRGLQQPDFNGVETTRCGGSGTGYTVCQELWITVPG